MPKPNQTMLDKLAETFKSMGKPAPFREMKLHGEFTDPMIKAQVNQKLAGNKIFKLDPSWRTPERVKYQQGLESLRRKKMNPVREAERGVRKDFEDLQSNFEDAYSDAYENWQDELNSNVADQAPLLEYGFEPADLDFDTPRADLRDFWPAYQETPEWFESEAGAYNDRLEELGDQLEYMRSPEYIQQLQTQTPRYRNYQRAMRQREENARLGRLNAAIMNLARQGYSMPEIREILRNQRIR